MAACFQDIEETNDIGINVRTGIIDTIADTGLSGQVDDDVRVVFVKGLLHRIGIGQVALDEGKARHIVEELQPRFFEGHSVIIIDVIQTDDGHALLQKPFGKVEADEACGTGYEDFLLFI